MEGRIVCCIFCAFHSIVCIVSFTIFFSVSDLPLVSNSVGGQEKDVQNPFVNEYKNKLVLETGV